MVREGRQEPRQEAAEEQRAGGAGEDHQHGGSKLKGKLSSLYGKAFWFPGAITMTHILILRQ